MALQTASVIKESSQEKKFKNSLARSFFDIDELLEKTARLIGERFDFYYVGIFIMASDGKIAVLKATHGASAAEMLARQHQVDVGSDTVAGWVSEHNKPRTVSEDGKETLFTKNELLPDTRSEVGIPISNEDTILGVLNAQSTHQNAFDEATVSLLVALSNQVATAIENLNLYQISGVNLNELSRLYRASREVLQEKTTDDILELTHQILEASPFLTLFITPAEKRINIYSSVEPSNNIAPFNANDSVGIPIEQIATAIKTDGMVINLEQDTPFLKEFSNILRKKGAQLTSFFSINQGDSVQAIAAISTQNKGLFTESIIQPYVNFIEIVSVALDKIQETQEAEKRFSEMEAVSVANQATASAQDLDALYPVIHEQIRQILGDYPFAVALYDENKKSIYLPYFYEDGEIGSVDHFPLGEGLASIIVRTGQPLMILENTEERIVALGAKLIGTGIAPKSWLGCPMLIDEKVIGVLIVQDLEKEKSFDENSLRFVSALANQVSGAIHNTKLLENSRNRSLQMESAAKIARDISGSLHVDELLSNVVSMIRERFGFYHASIFLVDALGEYAVVREASGDAGVQLKRSGYKLEVGSRSIVGYVSKQGELLVVDNTALDTTYYAHPLLPDTRSEAAIPLKVGERTLGVLDVQSAQAYAFPEEVLQTLNIIADQLAVAIINTELFAETQEHLSQHRLLHHITTSAASGTTIEESLRGAVQGLQVSLGGDRVSILLVDKEQENLYVGASVGYADDDKKLVVPIGSGVTGWVARNQKLLRIDDTNTDPRYLAVSKNTRSELAIPLIFRKELLGVLNVESERIAAYTEEDEEMLGTLAGSLAAIIANARLLQRVRRQAERERMLREITGKIRRSTDVETILATTARELTSAIGAQHAQIRVSADNPVDIESNDE